MMMMSWRGVKFTCNKLVITNPKHFLLVMLKNALAAPQQADFTSAE